MISDRLLARLRGLSGFVTTRWSLLRIAAFAVVGVTVITLLVPSRPGFLSLSTYNSTLATRRVRNVALPYGDTRGFKPTSHPRQFQVAWIGGSETLAVGAGHEAFIPGLVGKQIGRVGRRKVSTDVYYLNAIRLADELAALTLAVKRKPDLVVISLNPVWATNDIAVQQWGYLDGLLVRGALTSFSQAPVAVSLAAPGDLGWTLLSKASSAINDRLSWGTRISRTTQGWSFLHAVPDAKTPTPTGLAALALQRPVDFFVQHYGRRLPVGDVKDDQLRSLKTEALSKSSFNQTVIREMFSIVHKAGVDAYFYMAPINPSVYAQPTARRYVALVRKQLAKASAGRTTSKIMFDPNGLQDRVPLTGYKDIVHVYDGRPEAKVIATDICSLLARQGTQRGCEHR